MAKDAAFAKMYRPSSMKVARPAPPSMFACFFVRDLVCMAAFFTLPPQLSAELQAPLPPLSLLSYSQGARANQHTSRRSAPPRWRRTPRRSLLSPC